MCDKGNPKPVLCDDLNCWDGEEEEVGGETEGRWHRYAYGQFMLMYGRDHHSIAITLQIKGGCNVMWSMLILSQ